MKLLADENVESEMVSALREAGHDVTDIKEITPGIDDITVLTLAKDTNAILMTNDKDFGELVYRDRLTSGGVILMRFGGIELSKRADLMRGVLADRGLDLIGAF